MRILIQLLVFATVAVLTAAATPRVAGAFDLSSIEQEAAQSSLIMNVSDSLHPDGPRQKTYGTRQRRHSQNHSRRNAANNNRWSRSYNSALQRTTGSSYRHLHPDGPAQGTNFGRGYGGKNGKHRYGGDRREEQQSEYYPPRVFPSF